MNWVSFLLMLAAVIVFVLCWLGAQTKIANTNLGLALMAAALLLEDALEGLTLVKFK